MGHKNLVLGDPGRDYPEFLKPVLSRYNDASLLGANEPVVIRMQEKTAVKRLQEVARQFPGLTIIDTYAEQYAELLLSLNAHLYKANYDVQVASVADMLDKHYGNKPAWKLGSWVYFPWRNELVHILAQEDFEALRTIRNRDLISSQAQTRLFNFEVASFGMSVGSAGALALAISGISRRIKLIDSAVISGSNLNRILTGVSSVGLSKATVIGRQIYEMNPYSEIAYYDKATKQNIPRILTKPWKVRAVIDEIDEVETKVRLRYEARKHKLPVLMATDLGDSVMLDVERFDQEPDRPLLHNLAPGIEKLLESPPENYRQWTKFATSIIDVKNMSLHLQKSMLKIGSSIVTHPQLGATVMMTGGVLAFAAKSIALGEELHSGRYVISLENQLLASHQTRKYHRQHKKHTKVLQKAVDAM